MSDIKGDTWLSVCFLWLAEVTYAAALNKYRPRAEETKPGSEERFKDALEIITHLGLFDRLRCRMAGMFHSVSFFFMKDIDEQQYQAALSEAERLVDEHQEDTDED